eukprot:637231-Amorphochlora_amoeboformis.AAC.2
MRDPRHFNPRRRRRGNPSPWLRGTGDWRGQVYNLVTSKNGTRTLPPHKALNTKLPAIAHRYEFCRQRVTRGTCIVTFLVCFGFRVPEK